MYFKKQVKHIREQQIWEYFLPNELHDGNFMLVGVNYMYIWMSVLQNPLANGCCSVKEGGEKWSKCLKPALQSLFVCHFPPSLKSNSHLLKTLFYLLQWKPFKSDEKPFFLNLKVLFVLKLFKFLYWLFGHEEKTARLEIYD